MLRSALNGKPSRSMLLSSAVARDDLGPAHAAFFRSLRVKRKLSELDLQTVILLEFLDTPGDEVAPGSNKIGKNFENERFRHDRLLSLSAF